MSDDTDKEPLTYKNMQAEKSLTLTHVSPKYTEAQTTGDITMTERTGWGGGGGGNPMLKMTKEGRPPCKTGGMSQSPHRSRWINQMTTKKGRVRGNARGRGRAKVLTFCLEPRKKAAPNWMPKMTRPREMKTTQMS